MVRSYKCRVNVNLTLFYISALDHMLCSVLDAGITSNIVRLGSRSADERISPYSLETMEKVAGQSRLDRAFGQNYRALKEVEEEVKRLIQKFLTIPVNSDEISQYLEVQYPEHFEHTNQPPAWISAIKAISSLDGVWQHAGKKGQKEAIDDSMYAYWKNGHDLDFLEFRPDPVLDSQPTPADHLPGDNNKFNKLDSVTAGLDDDQPEATPGENVDSLTPLPNPPQSSIQLSDLRNPEEFFIGYGYDGVPPVPSSDRDLEILLDSGELWSMARSERERLHAYWIEQVRSNLHHNQLLEFERLREKHIDVLQRWTEGKDEVSMMKCIYSQAVLNIHTS